MLQQIRQSKYARAVAAYFIFHLLLPVSVFESRATTNGTGSTEFSPAAFGNMVDPFTGDFNYSIPLMEVPGPGGSYPIILGYSSSSVNSEADAGWVGLGWNLNIGSVSREVKGLPDDFKGDLVTKQYNMREATHSAFNVGGNALAEIFGFDLDIPVNIQLYQNSYTGFGLGFGASLASSHINFINTEKQQASVVGSLTLNYDTQKGFGFNCNYGIKSRFFNLMKQQGAYMRQGSLHSSMSGSFLGIAGFGKSLNKTNYIPGEGLPLKYSGYTLGLKLGIEFLGAHTPLDVSMSNSSQELAVSSEQLPAAGYLYLDYGHTQDNCLMDYNRENDMPVNEENKTLPVPVLQADEYFASGNDFNISFRPYRNDFGIVKPEKRSASFDAPSSDLEIDPPNPTQYKIGYNDVHVFSNIYTGPWQSARWNSLSHLKFGSDVPAPVTNDPELVTKEAVYFKSKDDLTKSNTGFLDQAGGYGASHFKVAYSGKEPVLVNALYGYLPVLSMAQYNPGERAVRETYIQHEKIGEITSSQLYATERFYVWTDTTSAGNPVEKPAGGTGTIQYDYPNDHDHHIGRFKVTSSNGVKYEYGLPVYNHTYVEAYYATNEHNTVSDYDNTTTVNPDGTEASVSNVSGSDHLFFKTSLPPFVTAHLLTAIRGHDYVDLKNDGITDDDLGYFMKFNYTQYYNDFRWRTPYKDAYYKMGKYSDHTDDKAAYSYGTKDVRYLNSIESKTHVAVFILKDRKDGCEPTDSPNHELSNEDANVGNRKLRYLDKIILYNKNDLSKPLQTVDLDYDYSLYPGVPSNYAGSGRLTLKSVKVTFLENDKGTSTPYTFTYKATPSYVALGNDRWGVTATTDAITDLDWDNLENTFQMQGDYNKDGLVNATDGTALTANVSKGLLSTIDLPSGGAINVDYESDDYGYVQNEQVQALVRILGTSETTEDELGTPDGAIRKKDLRIYFQLPEPIVDDGGGTSTEDGKVFRYISGLKQICFKTFQRLRERDWGVQDMVYDYVNGYAEPETTGYGVDATSLSSGKFHVGYITLKPAEYGALNLDVHPFRKAGWQYLRAERNDLETPVVGTGASPGVIAEFIDLLTSIPEILGYYNACAIKNYCSAMQLGEISSSEDTKPSFMRLNLPSYKKTGGGHRVHEITWTDNFGEHPHTMGQVYAYVTLDGKSSGVATTEPMNGKEDNTLASPRFYTADPNTIYKSDMNYLEGPVNESYFPSPSIGYSRVVVRNIPYSEQIPGTMTPDAVTDNDNGTDVHEFYTCKDFPVITRNSTLLHTGYNGIDINIPKGYDNYMYNGYSQGFYCVLNDMHGKPKLQATYRTGANLLTDAPIHQREYKYFTDENNQLKNKVPTLRFDGQAEETVMGEDYEFFAEMLEHSTSSVATGQQYNLDGVALIPIPGWFPTEVSESNVYRSMATNKIVHRKGILKEIVENNEGEITVTSNLYFDQLTGDALLTRVNNSFNDPVYNYHYAAHWYYDGMRPMYKNMHARLFNITSTGSVTLAGAGNQLHNGDQLTVLGNAGTTDPGVVLYVHNLDHTGFDLEDVDGNAPNLSGASLMVTASGFKNLQSIACGSLESLRNPVTENQNIFMLYNQQISSLANGTQETIEDVQVCDDEDTPSLIDVDFELVIGGGADHMEVATGACKFHVVFDIRTGAELQDFVFLSFQPSSGTMVLQDQVTGEIIHGTVSPEDQEDYATCFAPCFTVLNAASAEFESGDWDYNYADAGSPRIDLDPFGTPSEADLNSSNGNTYHYGKAGIFRVRKNYAYQVARKQQGTASSFETKIDKDGEYKSFTPFDWMVPGNEKWTWAQQLTRVSPYGITLETSDRSGILASSLVGFDQKTITAQSANAGYFETAYDGFEDYDYVTSAYVYDDHGHFSLNQVNLSETPSDVAISAVQSHTGKLSLVLEDDKKVVHAFEAAAVLPTGNYFEAVTNKRYMASGWFYAPGHYQTPVIKVKNITTGLYVTPFVTYNNYPAIEGWKKMEIGFEVSSTTDDYRIEWYLYDTNTSQIVDGYLDDVRVHPFKAAMVSMVYDPLTLWKTAELDNQNFATFYNYDEEGNVVQVKKETVNGVVTIGTTRSNVKRP